MNTPRWTRLLACAGALASVLVAAPQAAEACGGFFCSATQPVNQAAERIIFAKNPDGETVTAVIQIMYEGPAENFSWLLPISSVPTEDQIGVSSNVAFTRLQSATNPQYSLTTRVEGTCRSEEFAGGVPGAPTAGGGGASNSGGPGRDGGVNVVASGTVGAFNYRVLGLDADLTDRTAAAVAWLEENGYDVSPGSPALLKPYLDDGNYLLALKLVKGSDTGSIRPLRLTYEATKPIIPIKLTAVAANEDMGVMTWLLSDSRGVPENYRSLELNEARINWFNAASNYNDVVVAAADDAGGQGFVTELAGPTTALAQTVWTDFDEQSWTQFRGSSFAGTQQLFDQAFGQWGQWDGFWDVVRDTVTLPSGATIADLQLCPGCYANQLTFVPTAFVSGLEAQVIQPMRDVQELLDAHPYVTRLYTTMSADEMTADPVFTFNPELEPVSNVHTAERVIECSANLSQFEAPWRIELPQGGVLRGSGPPGAWPAAVDSQPPNFRIVQLAGAGPGQVLEDNAVSIRDALEGMGSGVGGSGASSGSGGLAGSMAGRGGSTTTPPTLPKNDSRGCSTTIGSTKDGSFGLVLLGALALLQRRRRGGATGATS